MPCLCAISYFLTMGYYFAAFLVGSLTGLAELLSKYSWSLKVIVHSPAGRTYLIINGLVAVFAYYAAVGWGLLENLAGAKEVWRVLFVSLFAMAALRSSFVNLKIGDQDVAGGLAVFLSVFSNRAERSLDQTVGLLRYEAMRTAVAGLRYRATQGHFMAVSAGVLRSLSADELDTLRQDVSKIDLAEVDDETKMVLFAVRLTEAIGDELFVKIASHVQPLLASENERISNEQSAKVKELEKFERELLDQS